MKKLTPLTLGACLLAFSSPAPATAQETTLDYAKLSSYLKEKYKERCEDGTSGTRKSLSCILSRSPYNPTYVEVTDSGKGISYTLTIRVDSRDDVSDFENFYEATVGAIGSLKAVAPTVRAAVNLCFDNSELGKNDRANCRYLPGNGMGFWGTGGDGFELIVQTSKNP